MLHSAVPFAKSSGVTLRMATTPCAVKKRPLPKPAPKSIEGLLVRRAILSGQTYREYRPPKRWLEIMSKMKFVNVAECRSASMPI
jgi:hypothetical protein